MDTGVIVAPWCGVCFVLTNKSEFCGWRGATYGGTWNGSVPFENKQTTFGR